MAFRIQLRRDTSTNWTDVNPVLAEGEPALEVDTGKIKVGDGTSSWSDLPYFGDNQFALKHHTHSIDDINIDDDVNCNTHKIYNIDTVTTNNLTSQHLYVLASQYGYNIQCDTNDNLVVGYGTNRTIVLEYNKAQVDINASVKANDFFINEQQTTYDSGTSGEYIFAAYGGTDRNVYNRFTIYWTGSNVNGEITFLVFTSGQSNNTTNPVITILNESYTGDKVISNISYREYTNDNLDKLLTYEVNNTTNSKLTVYVKITSMNINTFDIKFSEFTDTGDYPTKVETGNDTLFGIFSKEQLFTITSDSVKLNKLLTVYSNDSNDTNITNVEQSSDYTGIVEHGLVIKDNASSVNMRQFFSNNNNLVGLLGCDNSSSNFRTVLWSPSTIELKTIGDPTNNYSSAKTATFDSTGTFTASYLKPISNYKSVDGTSGVSGTVVFKDSKGNIVYMVVKNGIVTTLSTSSSSSTQQL